MAKFAGARSENIPNEQRVDTRRWGDKMTDSWSKPDGAYILATVLMGINFVCLMMPGFAILASIPSYILGKKFLNPKKRLHNMPFRVPKHLEVPDGSMEMPNKPFSSKTIKSYLGQGVSLWGVDRETGQQVWTSDDDNKTHSTILGTTGSGKSELIFNLINNQLIEDSGFIVVDAKGDISFQHRCCLLLRRYGREDDLLTISFAVGSRNFLKAQGDRPTNTMNIFSTTTSGMIIETISGMLDSSSGGGDDMWVGRCLAYVAGLTRPLTFLRDEGAIELTPSVYMDYMELPEVERLVYEKASLYPGFDKVLEPLRGFLITLPGYDTTKKMAQAQETNEQFGYITMQLTRVINDLGYIYGHIFNAEVGEIDISDVVLNRRCLTVLLPSLERSLPTLNMLGKLIIGSIKQMMAGSLGNKLEGLSRLVVDSRPSSADNSFRIILDEVGYMMVPGMSVIFAQARSLNISMCAAAQSFTDIKRGSPEEAEAIWDNSNLKIIGRIVGGDQSETWQKVEGAAGEKNQMYIDGYEQKDTFSGNFKYVTNKIVRRDTKAQIDYHDTSAQKDGQFSMIVPRKYDGGRKQGVAVIRFQGFYTGSIYKSDYMFLNDLIPVSDVTTAASNTKKKQELLREAIAKGTLSAELDLACFQGATAFSTVTGANENIVSFIEACQKEIDAQKSNANHENVVLGTTLNRLANTMKSIDSDKYYMPSNLIDTSVVQSTNNQIDNNISDDISQSQATRAVQNFQKNALPKDRELHSAPATFVYDQGAKDADKNPFDVAQPNKAIKIQTELTSAYRDEDTNLSSNEKMTAIADSISKEDKITDKKLDAHNEQQHVVIEESEILKPKDLQKAVEDSKIKQQQLAQLVSKQKTDGLSKEIIFSCINDSILDSSSTFSILDEEERDDLHNVLRNAAAFAISTKVE